MGAVLVGLIGLLAQQNAPVPFIRQLRAAIFGPRLSEAADQVFQLARSIVPPGAGLRSVPPPSGQPGEPVGAPVPTVQEGNPRPPAEPPLAEPVPAESAPLIAANQPQMAPVSPATPPPAAPGPTARPSTRAPGAGRPAPTGNVRSSGSAFFITDDGYALTSLHVVVGARRDRVVIRTKRGDFPAQVQATNAAYDVALLKVTGVFPSLPLANSQTIRLAEPVFTIGFPSPSIQGVEPKYTRGEINSLAGIQDDPHFFQVSVAIQPGNSGGPLVTPAGNVIGIIAMQLNDRVVEGIVGSLPQNVNYAVKSAYILTFLRSVPSVAARLKPAQLPGSRRYEDVVKAVEEAVGLVLVY